MEPKGNTHVERKISLDLADERQDELRKRGVLFVDSDEIDRDEAGCLYRDIFFLVTSGWPKQRPIWVVINSPGGQVHHGFAIYDAIHGFVAGGYTINTFGLGEVASMGTVILQAGTRRYAAPHTQFLLHQVSEAHIFLKEEATQAEERTEEMKRINVLVLTMIAERTGILLSELTAQVKKKDFWLGALDARGLGKHGLIDEISTTFPFMDALEKKD